MDAPVGAVIEACGDPSLTVAELARRVDRAAPVARVLARAAGEPARTADSICLVGVDAVHAIAVALEQLPDARASRHALATACAARLIARPLRIAPQRAFIAGLVAAAGEEVARTARLDAGLVDAALHADAPDRAVHDPLLARVAHAARWIADDRRPVPADDVRGALDLGDDIVARLRAELAIEIAPSVSARA